MGVRRASDSGKGGGFSAMSGGEGVSRREAVVSVAVLVAGAALGLAPSAEARGAVSYKVRYKLDGGRLAKGMPRSVRAGGYRLLSWMPKPTKRGYEFAGWFKDAGLKASATRVSGTRSKAGRTVYAKWRPKTYSISYDAAGGRIAGMARGRYTPETPTFPLPGAERLENEGLEGWVAAGDGEGALLTEVRHGSVGDLALRAAWGPRWSEGSERRAAGAAADSASGALTLLHFSDIHGSAADLQRIVSFTQRHPGAADAAICTGDLVAAWCGNGMGFWDSVAGSAEIMTCIGNHDTLASGTWDWRQKLTMREAAELYIDPYAASWGDDIERPEGATYYSRRFERQGVRLVVLDCMLSGADAEGQAAWLDSQLDAALRQGDAVVTASHYPTTRALAVPCPFTTSHEMIIDSLFPVARAAVARFRSRGGEFACHLAGHCHRDDVVSADGALGQCDVIIGAASSSKGQTQFDNTSREAGRFSQDLFNLVTVDRDAGTVTLRRIGADEDGNGSPRRAMTFDYRNGRIVG